MSEVRSEALEPARLVSELREALRLIFRRQLAERGMPLGQLGVLNYLFRAGRATPAQLATAEYVTPQSMSGLVRELESQGLVERTPDEADGRKVWLSLTESGHELVARQRSSTEGWLFEAVSDRLTEADRRLLAASVPVLRKLTGEQTAPAQDATKGADQSLSEGRAKSATKDPDEKPVAGGRGRG